MSWKGHRNARIFELWVYNGEPVKNVTKSHPIAKWCSRYRRSVEYGSFKSELHIGRQRRKFVIKLPARTPILDKPVSRSRLL